LEKKEQKQVRKGGVTTGNKCTNSQNIFEKWIHRGKERPDLACVVSKGGELLKRRYRSLRRECILEGKKNVPLIERKRTMESDLGLTALDVESPRQEKQPHKIVMPIEGRQGGIKNGNRIGQRGQRERNRQCQSYLTRRERSTDPVAKRKKKKKKRERSKTKSVLGIEVTKRGGKGTEGVEIIDDQLIWQVEEEGSVEENLLTKGVGDGAASCYILRRNQGGNKKREKRNRAEHD